MYSYEMRIHYDIVLHFLKNAYIYSLPWQIVSIYFCLVLSNNPFVDNDKKEGKEIVSIIGN